jgi:ribosomal protein S1
MEIPVEELNAVRPEGWADDRLVGSPDPWPELYECMRSGRRVDARVVGVEGRGEDCRYVLDLGGVRGYLPLREAGDGLPPDPVAAVGTFLACRVVACDRRQGTCLLERRSLVEEMARATWAELEEACREVLALREKEKELEREDSVLARAELRRLRLRIPEVAPSWRAVVRWVSRSRAVVDLGGVAGVLPRVEVSWSPPEHVREALKPGDCLVVKVIGLEPAERQAVVSRRWALPDPWQGADQRYRRGGVYEGKVLRQVSEGRALVVELEPGLGILVQSPPGGLGVGASVLVEVRGIDVAERRGSGRIVRVLSRP